MKFILSDQFYSDWKRLAKENKSHLNRLFKLIESIQKDGIMKGIGNPKAVPKYIKGAYSRRITEKHRLVYKTQGGDVALISCWGHYRDH